MLRLETADGYWLVRHPDHARLAGHFAEAWGNAQFQRPEPRDRVLRGIARHDDGWSTRDARPEITREGKPSAFSVELVGKYSAFEEIDLAAYLAVRENAVRLIAEEDAYAGMLVALHTYSLLTEHADRSTIRPEGLVLLDSFLDRQRNYQQTLLQRIAVDDTLLPETKTQERIREHFQLLQACDNLSLLACVAYRQPAHLLHALPCADGQAREVRVYPVGVRQFRLDPWPFSPSMLEFTFPARHVPGKTFGSAAALQQAFAGVPEERLTVRLQP